jgi:hypothetical protein
MRRLDAITAPPPGRAPDSWTEVAHRFGVDRRTVQRYMTGRVEVVEVGTWRALFRLYVGRPPRQLTSWGRSPG